MTLTEPWQHINNLASKTNAKGLCQMLDLQNIPWQLIEQSEHVELWVSRDYELALTIVKQWHFSVQGHTNSNSAAKKSGYIALWLKEIVDYPVTMLFVVLGTLGYLAYEFNIENILYFQETRFSSIDKLIESGQWWRFITPIFLHFDAFHLVFNLLLLWYFGKRIEYAKGSFYLLSLIITFALISNIVQFVHHPMNLFGGLSGVDYGIVGYLLAYQQFVRHHILNIPREYAMFLIISLAAGVFGVFEFFGISIANGAHVGGLVIGFVAGAFAGKLDQKS